MKGLARLAVVAALVFAPAAARADMKALEEAAKKEGELTWYTAHYTSEGAEELGAEFTKMYGIKVDELMPWHYHDLFFQEVPAVFKADLDRIYAQQDLVKLCRDFYRGIGLTILEGYGLTETSPVVAGNQPSATRIGTVGRPQPGVTVRMVLLAFELNQ